MHTHHPHPHTIGTFDYSSIDELEYSLHEEKELLALQMENSKLWNEIQHLKEENEALKSRLSQ